MCSVKEEHGHPIYCVAFNFIGECNNDIFASCGAARVSLRLHSMTDCSFSILGKYLELISFTGCYWQPRKALL